MSTAGACGHDGCKSPLKGGGAGATMNGTTTMQCTNGHIVLAHDVQGVSWVPTLDAVTHHLVPEGTTTSGTLVVKITELRDLPTMAVEAARLLLVDELLGDFPFVEESDRANALALLLLPFVRDVIAGPTPLHRFVSDEPDAGKSLVNAMCLLPAFGIVEVTDFSGYRTSKTRALVEALNRLPQVVKLDNVQGRVDLEALNSAIAGEPLTGVHVPVRAVWTATALTTAAEWSGSMDARTVLIRLDDELWTHRHFPVEAWATAHRAELVAAAVALVRQWVEVGRPLGDAGTLRKFPAWEAVMGGLLASCDVPGFLGNVGGSVSQRRATRAERVYRQWRQHYGDRWVTSRQVKEDGALRSVLAQGDKGWTSQSVGMYLHHLLADEPVAPSGLTLQRQGGKWRVVGR